MNIAVVSAKGGVGKSTFCVSLGQTLASHGKKTLLIDMDIGVRSLDLLLGVAEKTVYNWGDILLGNCETQKAVIGVSPMLYLLPAPLDYSYGEGGDFEKIIRELEKDFDFIIADSPAGIGRGFKLSLCGADMCIVISTPDSVSVRAATGAAASARNCGTENIRLVINRFSKRNNSGVCFDDYIDEIGARLLGIVPDVKSLRFLKPPLAVVPSSKEGLAFLRIAGRLCGEDIPLKM